MNRKHILILILLVCANAVTAIGYRTPELQRLARAVKINETLLHKGDCYTSVAGVAYHVRVKDTTVCHVGLHLFPQEIRDMDHSLVLDFLERYFLQLRHPAPQHTAVTMLKEDKVTFVKGGLAAAATLRPSDNFSYCYKEQGYEAVWRRGGKDIVKMTFPAEYQLLAGVDYEQASELLESDVKSFFSMGDAVGGVPVLVPSKMPGYHICKGNFYLSSQLNGHTYYHDTADGVKPVKDVTFPAESAANMLLLIEAGKGHILQMRQLLYGRKEKNWELPLDKWTAWCRHAGCDIFFGVESLETDHLKAVAIAVNQKEGYNHMLTLVIPFSAIEGEGGVKVTLQAFIPTHNIVDIMGVQNDKRPPTYKIFER